MGALLCSADPAAAERAAVAVARLAALASDRPDTDASASLGPALAAFPGILQGLATVMRRAVDGGGLSLAHTRLLTV